MPYGKYECEASCLQGDRFSHENNYFYVRNAVFPDRRLGVISMRHQSFFFHNVVSCVAQPDASRTPHMCAKRRWETLKRHALSHCDGARIVFFFGLQIF